MKIAFSPAFALPILVLTGGALSPLCAAPLETVPLETAPLGKRKAAPIIISEMRPGGPRGAQDAFIELFNTTSKPLVLTGYALRFRVLKSTFASIKIAPGTRIAARGHLLLTARNYSLNGLTRGDAKFTAPLFGGVALLDAKGALLDAVGPENGPTNPEKTLREGAGLPAFGFAPFLKTALSAAPQFSYARKSLDGQPQDTGDNAADFDLISVSGEIAGQKTRIGTPGPENATSPRLRPAPVVLVATAGSAAPTDAAPTASSIAFESDPDRLSMRRATRELGPLKSFGTLTLRYRLTNDSPDTLKKLTFRVNAITNDPSAEAPAGQADLRLIRGKAPPLLAPKSPGATPEIATEIPVNPVAGMAASDATEPAPQRTFSVWRAKLSSVPSQPLGGGLNALLEVDLPEKGIAPGARGEIWFSFGVERPGDYRVVLGNQYMNLVFEGNTETETSFDTRNGSGGGQNGMRSGTSISQVGGAGGRNNGGSAMGTGAGASAATQPPVEEAAGIVLEGNTDEGVTPPPVVPSGKSS